MIEGEFQDPRDVLTTVQIRSLEEIVLYQTSEKRGKGRFGRAPFKGALLKVPNNKKLLGGGHRY